MCVVFGGVARVYIFVVIHFVKKPVINFLDQLFSRIAEYLKKHDAYDRQSILNAINYGFNAMDDTHSPILENLDRAANISDWIKPYLAPIPNVSQFRQFKLEMIEGKVTVSARSRCAEDIEFNPWQDLTMTRGYSKVMSFIAHSVMICLYSCVVLCNMGVVLGV
jgi:hypothetical protein